MMDFSSKSCCVVDYGLHAELAVTLARSFGRVYLYVPWEGAYPTSNDLLVGTGLEGVEKIDSMWEVMGKVDLWVFPDTYLGPLQVYLRSVGQRVWGSGMGEELELFREWAKEELEKLGIPVAPYEVVTGIDALRKYLGKHENQFVKVSRVRGDFETFHSENYSLVEPKLDEVEHMLGAKKNVAQFMVESAIEDAVEVGLDGYSVDGEFPRSAVQGIEVKDAGYVGAFRSAEEIVPQLAWINDKLSQTLRRYKYRNFISVEARITKDGTPWVIDPCMRAPSPPAQLLQLMYANLAEIIWHGADGELVEPEAASVWGAEIMLHSEWANHNWQALEIPEKLRPQVKLAFPVVLEGKFYVTPQGYDNPVIGGVCGLGDTMRTAINAAKKAAEQVKGFYVKAPVDALDKANEEIKGLEEFGITL